MTVLADLRNENTWPATFLLGECIRHSGCFSDITHGTVLTYLVFVHTRERVDLCLVATEYLLESIRHLADGGPNTGSVDSKLEKVVLEIAVGSIHACSSG